MKGEFISIETAKINADIEKENKELQERIDRAIDHIRKCCNMDSKWVNLHFDYAQNDMRSEDVDELLNILEGKE